MTAHSYSLRSKVSSSSLTSRTPTQSPHPKSSKSPRKGSSSVSALQLQHVIGTTTSTPGGLSCCIATGSYAYCAGAVAVLASFDSNDHATYRYFKAKPTALPINQVNSYYDSPSTSNTPTRRRTNLISRRGCDDYSVNTLNRDWLEESGGQTWSARERIKATSCVSISPDGKLLAVGETGYNPRVLLFSTAASLSSDIPLSIMTDHTVGVRGVAFSPNSKYLATLGDINDGFLCIWRVNTKTGTAKLHSSNKCTSNICDMTWCGNTVVTVGTRHIKVWQADGTNANQLNRGSRLRREGDVSSPLPTPLQGRNCLLGAFVDATFTAVVAISTDQAIVCADDGYICRLDLSHGKAELLLMERAETNVAALSCRQDPLRLIWAGKDGLPEERNLDTDFPQNNNKQTRSSLVDARKRRRLSRQSLLRHSLGLSPPKRAQTVALASLDDKTVSIDADGVIRVVRSDTCDLDTEAHVFSSHNGAVKGAQKLPNDTDLGAFLTWSRDGEVRFWDNRGKLLRAETVDLGECSDADNVTPNELKVVRYSKCGRTVIIGDQFGVLKVLEERSWVCVQTIRAHSAEINDIDVCESSSLMSTCGRDRMVQIFALKGSEVELLQTSDDHISAVNRVLFSADGKRLLSCSADRTIVVRDRVERKLECETISAFIPTRTVTLKAAPLSMSFMPAQTNMVIVSSMDRYIVKLDLASGAVLDSFKVADRETDDTVVLNTICVSNTSLTDSCYLLAGYSSIDKSIRVYDMNKGSLLGRDSGHTEGISDIVMFENDSGEGTMSQTTIVTTGLDSTIMLWSATASGQPTLTPQHELSQAQAMDTEPEKNNTKSSPALLPPLRRVLSKIDIAEYARQHSPTREISPGGLRRKTSRLALTTSINEAGENTDIEKGSGGLRTKNNGPDERSPSPPAAPAVQLKKQRSRSEVKKESEARNTHTRESPSPPAHSVPIMAAAKHHTRANNARLRRPPSVPSDLRAHAVSQSRRLSMSNTFNANDFGNISVATEQACRMLKVYRKRLQVSKGEVDLDDIEVDLDAVLKVVRQKKAKLNGGVRPAKETKAAADDEIDGLSVLLEKTSVT